MDAKGKIVTVTDRIEPADLGVTLTHEHLCADTPSFFIPPPKKFEHLTNVPFEMKNLGWIRQNPWCHKPNLSLVGEENAIREELLIYKENGGHSIVESTSHGMQRNIQLMKELSQSTGVKIIAGTGFYCENYQKETVRHYSEEIMTDLIRTDLADGVDGVKCGVVGEIGCTWPLTEFEKRSLRSAAAAQMEFGCPVNIHPGRDPKAPDEIMRVFLEAGGKAEYTVMSHIDRTIFDINSLLEFAEIGTYLEYDLFGIEVSYYSLNEATDMLSDAQRIQTMKSLVDQGLEDRIVIAHDIYTKHRLIKYGGHGYSHILMNVVPKMLNRGFSQEQIDKILKHNPSTWLTFH